MSSQKTWRIKPFLDRSCNSTLAFERFSRVTRVNQVARIEWTDAVYKMARSGRGLLTSFIANRRGIASLEFALIALPFFAILFAIFQIGIVYLADNLLETATEKAARQLLTGQVQNAGLTASQFTSAICPNLPVFFTCPSGVMVDLQDVSSFSSANLSAPTLTYDSNGKVTNNWQFQTGGAASILVLRVMYQFPVYLGPLGLNLANLSNGKRLLMSTAVFQVEPYNLQGAGN
ncbi:pilus assembly protein [Rhodoblastus acidophilus]|uniref:TadE/TadG family type IV pilus assembly protein n=1 Tax=Candidatus Rhodoblastus alkanivorans TaxID=2954117 RepID=UPI001FA9E2FD|nr:TadE/TadG family type IV pilus assembly protein [Candidatus Rhodoblastus alkanivorans]MCI4679720.1 pilus assembly protein [Candidatus Rhodoblastus alkanivorans]MDI4643008.1 pilus assembly protein [Rhodoblastus acidophilus]